MKDRLPPFFKPRELKKTNTSSRKCNEGVKSTNITEFDEGTGIADDG